MILKGKAHLVGDHIDTDAILPSRFMVTTDRRELGTHCMEGLEPGWGQRIRPGDFIVAGRNFGCGSSREHAPQALLGAGVSAVFAESFARIFYRNGFNMGLPLFQLPPGAREAIGEGDELEIDVQSGIMTDLTSLQTISCNAIPPFMLNILSSGGLVEYVKKQTRR
ncbi:MAG: 3-isopropylmalate dehydratase small subunit [Desulfovibrionaceae bacterium]|nr:3-isopropylmalate dehydratase small subunit [Desulfovibrionaceae bacterium]